MNKQKYNNQAAGAKLMQFLQKIKNKMKNYEHIM